MGERLTNDLRDKARNVLRKNDMGGWTRPASHLYPHQWLWDSCFIAIGLATYDPQRAAKEINSLLRGQWHNGMMPHIIFSSDQQYWVGPDFWQSDRSPVAPKGVKTSGITQPPMLAIAAERVAAALPSAESEEFLTRVLPKIINYHEWIYRERDVDGNGLAVIIHPWEAGLDNTPPWSESLKTLDSKLSFLLLARLKADRLVGWLRRDTRLVPKSERASDEEALKNLVLMSKYRNLNYDSLSILRNLHVGQESLVFNSVLAAANEALLRMTKGSLPKFLKDKFSLTKSALEELWDSQEEQYFPRDFLKHELIKEESIATFLPLFAGTCSRERAAKLHRLLRDESKYNPAYPVPTAPLDSLYFSERRYWQGPAWINMNWMIAQGLKNYGYHDDAKRIALSSLRLVQESGFREYFSPLTGKGFGAKDFSWTAALLLDDT